MLEVVSLKDKNAVVLDTSVCYPEMGGQVGDADVAGDQRGSGVQRDRGESHLSAPAAGEVGPGAVGEGREGPLSGGAPVVAGAVLG